MSNSQPRSMSAQNHNLLRNRHAWRLLEIVLWSVLGWFYWMAFMVLLVWTVAQIQVDWTLRQQPQLTYRLYEYARIGSDWRSLSATADIARPMLALLRSQESNQLQDALRQVSGIVPVPPAITFAALEATLDVVVDAGDEMRDLSELQQTAEDIERYLAEPSTENLRTSMQSYADAAKALQRAQQDFDTIVSTVEPVVQIGDSVMGAIANGLRTGVPLASTIGLNQQVTQLADYLEQLPKPAGILVGQAHNYSMQAVKDVALLDSIHEAVATADLRETICTYGIFRGFIHWFLKYVWWIDAVVVAAIIARLLAAYSRLFLPASARRQPQAGYAATITI